VKREEFHQKNYYIDSIAQLDVQEGNDTPHVYRYNEVVVLRGSCFEQRREENGEEITTELFSISRKSAKRYREIGKIRTYRERGDETDKAKEPSTEHD